MQPHHAWTPAPPSLYPSSLPHRHYYTHSLLTHQLSLLRLLQQLRPLQLLHIVTPIRVANLTLTGCAVVMQPVATVGAHVLHALGSPLGGYSSGGCGPVCL